MHHLTHFALCRISWSLKKIWFVHLSDPPPPPIDVKKSSCLCLIVNSQPFWMRHCSVKSWIQRLWWNDYCFSQLYLPWMCQIYLSNIANTYIYQCVKKNKRIKSIHRKTCCGILWEKKIKLQLEHIKYLRLQFITYMWYINRIGNVLVLSAPWFRFYHRKLFHMNLGIVCHQRHSIQKKIHVQTADWLTETWRVTGARKSSRELGVINSRCSHYNTYLKISLWNKPLNY